jgi:hypothetical protein
MAIALSTEILTLFKSITNKRARVVIKLETFRVKSSDGRSIAAYKFGDLSAVRRDRLGGRSVFSKAFKRLLYEKSGGRCGVCSGRFEFRYFQVDHCIPYEVAGEGRGGERDIAHYRLLCGSCNRAKSWSCEHCQNLLVGKLPDICSRCYWASPEDYVHVALNEVRRVDVVWEREEVEVYDRLKREAQVKKYEVPRYVKKIIAAHVKSSRQTSSR